MKYTQAQRDLYNQCKNFDGTIDVCRWQLAQVATEAEENKVDSWAEIVGSACGREKSTVYEWRRAYLVRNSINPKSKLRISYWVTAANALNHVPNADIVDWLATCEADDKITLESARAQFPRKGKADKELSALLSAEADRLAEYRLRPDAAEIDGQLERAFVALREAQVHLIGLEKVTA